MHFYLSARFCISASVSESLFAAAEAEEWLFLERFEELLIDLCQSTKHCAVAAAPISVFSSPPLLFLCLLIALFIPLIGLFFLIYLDFQTFQL